jgi:hypothetical protein
MKISSNYSEFRNGPESCAFMVQNIYNLLSFTRKRYRPAGSEEKSAMRV